jgi:hypothetical protein
MSTADRDREASNLQASGLTWVEVAERLGLANGGVARRCAMRHRDRTGDTPDPTIRQPEDTEPESLDIVERVSQTEITINGRTVTPNTEISIRGESGRFTFRYSLRPDEVTVWGGDPQYEKWRTFKIDRVRTVHRKPRLRKNAEALEDEDAA